MSKKKTGTKKNNQLPPQWQPIARLPLLTTLIDGMLESADEQYQTLQLARQRPHVLDDYTVGRVITVFTKQQKDLGLYDEQVQRWQAEALTDEQRGDLAHLVSHLQRLHTVIAAVLKLADELKAHTIEKVLAKSDEELGLEFLMGMFKEKP